MVNKSALYKSPCQVSRTPMGIHMICPILGIIFEDENGCFIPDGTFCQMFDEHAHSQIVVCHMRLGCWSSQSDTFGMVIAETNCIELGNTTRLQQRIKFVFPNPEPQGILNGEVITGKRS